MTDTEKLAVANLIAAIHDERRATAPIHLHLADVEEARLMNEQYIARARLALDAEIMVVRDLIRTPMAPMPTIPTIPTTTKE